MSMYLTSRKSHGLSPVYILYFTLIYSVFGENELDIIDVVADGQLSRNATVTCLAMPVATDITWTFNGQPLNTSDVLSIKNGTRTAEIRTEMKESTIFIKNATRSHAGNYSCIASFGGQNMTQTKLLDLSYPARFTSNKTLYEINATQSDHGTHQIVLECRFEIYENPKFVEWFHPGIDESTQTNFTRKDREIVSHYTVEDISYNKDNGVYKCQITEPVNNTQISGNISLVVYGNPTMVAEGIGINTTAIYVNWTIDPANSKIKNIFLSYGKVGEQESYQNEKIFNNSTSYLLNNLEKGTNYSITMEVVTMHSSYKNPKFVCYTLEFDPVFVPTISINGFSATSVTIGISAPPKEVEKYVHYYLLEAENKNGGPSRKAYHSIDSRNLPYMFDNLEPYSTYIFKVRACQDFTKQCWAWSNATEAATLDGVPGVPSNVQYNCTQTHMFITWASPKKPNAEIKGYMLEFTGLAEYRDRNGALKKETVGPLSRFKSNDTLSAWFDIQPNTQYIVRLSAMTRTRRRGEEITITCKTSHAPPDMPPRPRWRKILDKDRYVFKMHLPKVSERNGPICCYRVYMVRLKPHKDVRDLPEKCSALEVIDYEEAHSAQPALGAYITDIFTNDNFPAENELILGDDHSIFNRSDPAFTRGCERCLKRPPPPEMPHTRVITTLPPTTTTSDDGITDAPDDERRRRDVDRNFAEDDIMNDSTRVEDDRDIVHVKDGALDSAANYTVFVELIPATIPEQPTPPPSLFSDYLNQLMPAPSPIATAPSSTLEIALQATCGVAALILILMIIFCVMQSRRTRKMQPRGRYEMTPIPRFIRELWGGRACRQAVPCAAAEAPPIAREELAAAYAQRHADCDLGFQMEFELLQKLSEYYPDRTTHASEARENQSKNRYPDIKAYDQTRVKLSQIDSISGSDYINANYVMGYKERKKFICAQGPTDTTVNDFWRMIWEHGLELIVMLTNLEEYSKVKCSKYWPDDVRGSRAFGQITVTHVSEKRYSDYIVRELKISKQPITADGQPIVENNGVAKRNGDIKEGSESVPTSPRGADSERGERTVRQYHFLMWKDFAAPEHPHSILKFIKRVNEAWSGMVGRPVVVHCSAGVGRTGTLVALDCLLQQLNSTGQVSVFNTIAELRRQRNFLVQSQKQYVFVYRALVEYAHYGDTEIPASKLRSAIDQLRNTPEGADKCLLEIQFEKILNSPVVEPMKSCAAASAEELRARNRSQECLPYDRNRVMLTPIPGRDFSTYINASFIEAYDNSEGFIITQDPLPNTIFDFWRMVSEQSVSTIVMLSELGEGKCPRYWDDGTAQYEHISVQYEDSESLPYYTRRQFRVTNNKSGCVCTVRQLQYQGWPTAPGHVPEVTRGLAELADAAQPAPAPAPAAPDAGPMLVHCQLGTERSALFVALCSLIAALRVERRADVCAAARKVRDQRHRTIDTVLQYEFLHRAILNYAELHNLLEDS